MPAQERKAIDNALDKMASLGSMLPFPHSSKVMGDPGGSLREPRPPRRNALESFEGNGYAVVVAAT